MADPVNLEFIAAQLRNMIEDQRAIRDEQRAMRTDLHRIADTLIGLSRSIEHIREDIVAMLKAEIGGFSPILRRGSNAALRQKSRSASPTRLGTKRRCPRPRWPPSPAQPAFYHSGRG